MNFSSSRLHLLVSLLLGENAAIQGHFTKSSNTSAGGDMKKFVRKVQSAYFHETGECSAVSNPAELEKAILGCNESHEKVLTLCAGTRVSFVAGEHLSEGINLNGLQCEINCKGGDTKPSCTIDGGRSTGRQGRLFTTSGNTHVTLKGMTLQNSGFSLLTNNDGGAIHISGVEGSSSMFLENCILDDNAAKFGGALQARDGAELRVTGSKFTRNIAIEGGAMDLFSGSPNNPLSVTVQQALFEDNHSLDIGGAIGIFGPAQVALSSSVIIQNTAKRGGGISASEGANLIMDRVQFVANESTETKFSGGGAVYVLDFHTDGTAVKCVSESAEDFQGNSPNMITNAVMNGVVPRVDCRSDIVDEVVL